MSTQNHNTNKKRLSADNNSLSVDRPTIVRQNGIVHVIDFKKV
jgi:hypothetical protein